VPRAGRVTAPACPPPAAPSALLVERLLDEQAELTAVDRFAQRHAGVVEPLLAPHYRELIPVGRTPGDGQQLAFRVDLDACSGCKACVSACHSLNGLRSDEAWRAVGLVAGYGASSSFQQTVTTACHHCEDPACLLGCPARAYEKDGITGIVRHLDDQCIGCRYCVLTCPYEVPSFDAALGIVRKCDMCADRLAVGEAPACVQGCPTSAISIEIVEAADPDPLLPGLGGHLPDSRLTRPTTRYVTSRAPQALLPADTALPTPRSGHVPLELMLVLVQASVGLLAAGAIATLFAAPSAMVRSGLLSAAAGAAATGLAASTAHLGRPSLAMRAVLGWRTSWMSREILAFGVYLGLLASAVLAATLGRSDAYPAGMALAAGLVAIGCSIGVYAVTGRPWWSPARTTLAFTSTVTLLGAAGLSAAGLGAAWLGDLSLAPMLLPGVTAAAAVATARAVHRRLDLRTGDRDPGTGDLHPGTTDRDRRAGDLDPGTGDRARRAGDLHRSRSLLQGPLRRTRRARDLLTASGLAMLAAAAAGPSSAIAAIVATAALATLIGGELLDRRLFFAAEAARGMPGL